MAISPSTKKPQYDLELERLDNGDRIGFVFADGTGKRKWDAITIAPYPRHSLQTYQGGSNYDSQEPPYRTITQQEWIGGRGQMRLENDATRFMDSANIHSWFSGKFFLGGQPTWATGYTSSLVQDTPGSMLWTTLTGANLFLARNFTPTVTGEADVLLWIRRVGTPGNLNVSLYSATGAPGNPNASVEMEAVSASAVVPDFAVMRRFAFSTTISSGTVYFIVVTNAGTDDASNYWEIATETGGSLGRASANGTSWSTVNTGLHYITYDNGNGVRDIIPFIYKHQAYAVVRTQTKANSTLYMAGDRGAADANTGALTTLVDATKSWTVNGWAGDIVLLTAGAGTEETRPWRTISSNTSTALTVDTPWLVEHTTDTEYIIISKKFQSMLDLGGDVTDIALAGDNIYFARGESAVILRYQAYNNAGTWTARSDAENAYGVHLLQQREPIGDEYLWVSRNDDNNLGPHVQRFNVPVGWGDLYRRILTMADTKRLWSEYVQASDTVSVLTPDIVRIQTNLGATGVIVAHDLDAPVDLRRGARLGLHVRPTGGSVPAVTLRLSDTPWFDRKAQASAVYHATRPYRLPAGLIKFSNNTGAADMKHFDGSTSWYSLPNSEIGDTQYASSFTIADTNDELYIGQTDQFNGLYWYLQSVNNNAATVTVKYWDGHTWSAIGITDGTALAGATLGQSGEMSLDITTIKDWCAGSDDTTNLDVSLYWLQLTFSAALDEVIAGIVETNNSTRPKTITTTTLSRASDADDNSYHIIYRWTAPDWLYVFGNDPFDEIKFDMGATVNAVAATMSAEYFNGDEFVSPTNFSDGTASGGATLAQDGSVTFDLPDDMGELVVGSITGYCVRLAVSAPLTNDLKVQEVDVRNRRKQVFTELEVSGYGSLASSPDAMGDVPVFASGDYLYVGGDDRFDMISAVVDGTILNNNAATWTLYYFDGENWVNGSVSDGTASGGATLAQSGDLTFSTGVDLMQRSEINGRSAYWVRLKASAALDPVLIHGLTIQRQNVISVALSGATMATGQWYFLTGANLIYSANQNGVDLSNIQSVEVSIDALPTTLDLRGGLMLVSLDGLIVEGFGPKSDRITGLELYGQLRQNPWVLTEGGVYEIQTQNNGDVAPIPLRELSTLRHPHNGRVHTTNDTYLYFNLGSHIQRYFNQTLDNIGWTRDEGVPYNRSGEPSFLLSSPGGIYAGLDAGSDGYSAVMFGQARAWHTLFLAPYGMSVNHACIQSVPGRTLDRMWVNLGGLLMFLPIPSDTFDPTHDGDFIYESEGFLITSWISADLYSLRKIFKSLAIYAENLASSTSIYIKAFYQMETGTWDGAWTAVPELFDASPIEEHDLSTTQVAARRVRFRINLRTNDQSTSPIVYALLAELLIRFPTKNAYTFQHRMADNDEDKQGRKRKGLNSYDYIITNLAALGNDLTLCRIHSKDPVIDGKTVVVEPSTMRPYYDQEKQAYILETTLLEA